SILHGSTWPWFCFRNDSTSLRVFRRQACALLQRARPKHKLSRGRAGPVRFRSQGGTSPMKPPTTTYRPLLLAVAAAVSCACGMMPASALAGSATKADGAVSNAALLERIDALEEEIKQLRKDTRVLEVYDD